MKKIILIIFTLVVTGQASAGEKAYCYNQNFKLVDTIAPACSHLVPWVIEQYPNCKIKALMPFDQFCFLTEGNWTKMSRFKLKHRKSNAKDVIYDQLVLTEYKKESVKTSPEVIVETISANFLNENKKDFFTGPNNIKLEMRYYILEFSPTDKQIVADFNHIRVGNTVYATDYYNGKPYESKVSQEMLELYE